MQKQEPIRLSIRELIAFAAIILICSIGLIAIWNIGTWAGVIIGFFLMGVVIVIILIAYSVALAREQEIMMTEATWEDAPEEEQDNWSYPEIAPADDDPFITV